MKNIADNNLILFKSITRKKDRTLLANFKAQGVKGATTFSASIAVDITSLEDVDPGDPMEKIIEAAAKMATKEFKRADLQFEGVSAI